MSLRSGSKEGVDGNSIALQNLGPPLPLSFLLSRALIPSLSLTLVEGSDCKEYNKKHSHFLNRLASRKGTQPSLCDYISYLPSKCLSVFLSKPSQLGSICS